jgi:ABC-type transport system involved in multi-copper enzyme maturation permease subunit
MATMLLPLLWKDVRLNKFVMVLALFLVDTPYLTTVLFLSAFTGDPENNTSVTERLTIAFPFSLLFMALASAFIGASPISAEKAERTDRFLAYLPPTRLAVVTSKALIALGLLLLAWIVPLGVFFACVKPGPTKFFLYYALSASLILFALAWLVSLYVRSSTLAAMLAIVGSIALLIAVRKLAFAYYGPHIDNVHMIHLLLWSSIGVAIAGLAAGIAIFLRLPAD